MEDLDLSELLGALAAGARAVQGLPVDDDFNFHMALPDFPIKLAHDEIWRTLSLCVQDLRDDQDIHDPSLWEACADACDSLLAQVEAYLEDTEKTNLQNLSDLSRKTYRTKAQQIQQGTVDMEKPQITYGIVPQNSRTEAFVPNVHPDKPHGITPLDLTLLDGDGLGTRNPFKSTRIAPDVIAPSQHVLHPYLQEIEKFEYTSEQTKAPSGIDQGTMIAKPDGLLEATWIDTPEQLEELAVELEKEKEIALDLEAHSLRSFAGITCLMQVSTRQQNYLIDTLKLHSHMHAMASPLANPNIVKVMHGADGDIEWLQRDFGLYVVNLFDTGRAARALNFTSAGYAYLLHTFVDITADKSFQLSDWRQRPLPEKMKEYAIQDTHYLLDIYDRLRVLLSESSDTSIEQVLDTSRKVSLIRYSGEPFRPSEYKAKLVSRTMQLSETQEKVAAVLWDWRDSVARQHDESTHYVCRTDQLRRVVMACPTTVASLQQLLSPMPKLVLQHSSELLNLIKSIIHSGDEEEELQSNVVVPTPGLAPSSAFFKPAEPEDQSRGMLSPVLGTEALYNLVGWTTPQELPNEEKERTWSVDSANKNFQSSTYSDHSIEMGSDGRSRSADGSATAKASRESQSPLDEERKLARQSSARVREQKDAIPAVLGLITPSNEVEDDDIDEHVGVSREKDDPDDFEFEIPRSMREIYQISNRNRRNKKTGSPTPERGVTPTTEKEREELAKAESMLRDRGLIGPGGYFDDLGSPGKRPRTKSRTGRESEESVPQEPSSNASKEDDLAYLKKIGYVDEAENLDSMMQNQSYIIPPPAPVDYSGVGPMGALGQSPSANPFFAGAAIAGGNLLHGKVEKKKAAAPSPSNKQKPSRKQQEKPEKKDGKMHAYRKR